MFLAPLICRCRPKGRTQPAVGPGAGLKLACKLAFLKHLPFRNATLVGPFTKSVILAGGLGTRISEETHLEPNPLVEIDGRPFLWHILKIYSSFGINKL